MLLVDKEGVPIAVEVKLARNAQSRREVMAQAFDYVSDLSQLTFSELDDIVDGALSGALESLVGTDQFAFFRKQSETNLRAGRVKLVIAIDSAGEDLIRIIRYVKDHSDIDVRLVSLSKFDNGRYFVPRILVSGSEGQLGSRVSTSRNQEKDSAFENVVAAYDSVAPAELRTRGRGKTFRQIRLDEWPASVHYEFMNSSDEIGVELHLEANNVKDLKSVLSSFHKHAMTSGLTLEWDPNWSGNRGRLFAKVAKDQKPELATALMNELIQLTKKQVDDYVTKMPANNGMQPSAEGDG